MRFVSRFQKYSIQARPQRQVVTVDGYPIVAQEQILCDFHHGGLSPWEIDAALKHFTFKGLPTEVPPQTRLSVFDTEWMTDPAEREEVEQFLLRAHQRNQDYILVEKPRLEAPWPNYDKVRGVKTLVQKVVDDGYDVDYVIAYERENANRTEVIEALESIGTEEQVEEEIAA